MTVDPVKDGNNWYQYCISDPVNVIDPLGLDIIILNDSDAVEDHGHNAIIVGNDDDGWTYYSKDGKWKDTKGKEVIYEDADSNEIIMSGVIRTENGNVRNPYDTYEQFDQDKGISGRYDRRARIETTKDEDEAMKEIGDQIYDEEYNFGAENCADLVERIADVGGIDLSGADIAGVTEPNKQYDEALEEIKNQSQNICDE